MRKKIKQCGASVCILFTKEEREIYQLKPGDIVDITVRHVYAPPRPVAPHRGEKEV